MKYLLTLAALSSALICRAQAGFFETFQSGTSLTVSVEKVVYKSEQLPFALRIRLENTGTRTLGVYWKDNAHRFYPNQWGMYDTTYRMVVDEIRILPDKPNVNLRKLFADHQLIYIPPGQQFYYYIGFNAGKPGDVQKAKGKYLIVSLDGQLWYTDQKKVYTLNFGGTSVSSGGDHHSEINFRLPLQWEPIPTGNALYH